MSASPSGRVGKVSLPHRSYIFPTELDSGLALHAQRVGTGRLLEITSGFWRGGEGHSPQVGSLSWEIDESLGEAAEASILGLKPEPEVVKTTPGIQERRPKARVFSHT